MRESARRRQDGLRGRCIGYDFGAKGYGNLVELAWRQHHCADALGRAAGRLMMIIKSAHVYETEFGSVRRVLAEVGSGR